MRSAYSIALGLVALASVTASAQPNCKKGKPCGNTCIAQNRTCHIQRAPAEDPRPADRSPTTQSLYGTAPTARPATVDSLFPWVVSSNGATYFAAACSGAESIPRANRMFFRTEENLQRLGMARATAKDERCTLQQLQEHELRVSAATRNR